MNSTPSTPPWERGAWRRVHLWGVKNPKWYYITPASAWAVLIYATCLLNMKPIEDLDFVPLIPGGDKILHFLFYAVLAMLIIRGVNREKMAPIGLHGLVFAMCVTFGAMIEVQQLATGHRSFEWLDILADTIGALAGLAAWHWMMLRWGKRTKMYPGLFK